MYKGNRTATINTVQIVFDAITIILAYFFANAIYHNIRKTNLFMEHIWILIMLEVIIILCLYLYKMYDLTIFYYADRIVIRTFVAVVMAAFCISITVFLLQLNETSRLVFIFSSLICYVLLLVQRFSIRFLRKNGIIKPKTRVMFIGHQSDYEEYVRFTLKTALIQEYIECMEFSNPIFKHRKKLIEYIIQNQIDEVVILFDDSQNIDYEKYLMNIQEMGLTVHFAFKLMKNCKSYKYISSIGTYPVVTYHSTSRARMQLMLKRVVDFALAFIGLLITSPVLILTAIAIKLDSKGPVFFKQRRVGLNGKQFYIYKFRSMCTDAEKKKNDLADKNKIGNNLMFKIDNDPRITRVGKFIRKTSIDELPQFINVLIGNMSIVGTRPPTIDEVLNYEPKHRQRISIKPGITGMWQVSGRSNIDNFEEVVDLDTSYINNWNLWLDFKIIFKTVGVVLSRKGAA